MKSKGGRAKKAPYETIVIRIPLPLKDKVVALMNEFYSSIPVTGIEPRGVDKPVTGIKPRDVNKPVTSIEPGNVEIPVTGIESGDVEKPVTPIEALEFSNRVYMRLKRARINTLSELQAFKQSGELSEIIGLGEVSLKQIDETLARLD
jgi:hypothetical protein